MVDFTNNECLTILRARHKFEYEYCHGMNNVCNLQSEAQCQTQSHSHYDCKADDKNNINSVKQKKNWVKSQPEAVDEAQGCNRWSMKQKKNTFPILTDQLSVHSSLHCTGELHQSEDLCNTVHVHLFSKLERCKNICELTEIDRWTDE